MKVFDENDEEVPDGLAGGFIAAEADKRYSAAAVKLSAARAKSEAIERDQSSLRIAGHRISLALSCAYIACGSYRRSA